MNNFNDLISLKNVSALVLGDVMLDRYEYGRAERISPEAPVPVFRPEETKEMLGGVGNVAANLVALGVKTRLLTRTGNDTEHFSISRLLKKIAVPASLFRQGKFHTTVKTRIIAGNNHLLRVDNENHLPLATKGEAEVLATVCKLIKGTNVVVISDYGKGFVTHNLCSQVIAQCKKYNIPSIIDPKGTDYSKYKYATLIKPNLKEFADATGKTFNAKSPNFKDEITYAARKLISKFHFGGILVTLSEYGMMYVSAKPLCKALYIPTQAKEVFDVSGAGDTAIASLAAGIGAGFSVETAMRIANAASSIVVSKLGTATASLDELKEFLSPHAIRLPARKILTLNDAQNAIRALKSQGKRIGFTNGCFDCCHLGHLSSLFEAKKLCDVLVVGVNSDNWIRKHKGADRPIQDQATRTTLVASLECVDIVVAFEDETALPLVKKLRPHVIAKEGYSLDKWPEGRFVNSIGGEAVILKRVDGYSTTNLANKMKS